MAGGTFNPSSMFFQQLLDPEFWAQKGVEPPGPGQHIPLVHQQNLNTGLRATGVPGDNPAIVKKPIQDRVPGTPGADVNNPDTMRMIKDARSPAEMYRGPRGLPGLRPEDVNVPETVFPPETLPMPPGPYENGNVPQPPFTPIPVDVPPPEVMSDTPVTPSQEPAPSYATAPDVIPNVAPSQAPAPAAPGNLFGSALGMIQALAPPELPHSGPPPIPAPRPIDNRLLEVAMMNRRQGPTGVSGMLSLLGR